PLGRRLEGELRLLRLAAGLQRHAGIEVDDAVGGEPRAVLLDRHMSGKSAVEIFADRFDDALFNSGAEGVADLHVFARYAKVHLALTPLTVSHCREFIPVALSHKAAIGFRAVGAGASRDH